APSAPGQFPAGPGAPGQFPAGPGAPGQFPGAPSGPGQFPGAPGQFPGAPSGPGQFPAGPGAPGQFPYPSPGGQAPGGFPPSSGPFAGGPFQTPSGPFGPPPGTWGPPASQPFPPGPHPAQPGSFGPGPAGPWGSFPAPSGPSSNFGGPAAPTVPPSGPAGALPVPYELPLQAGLMPRLLITIAGETTKNPVRFHFDFLRGTDSVFHFNPRFDEKAVVRNSCLNGRWGAEERQGGFPFLPGKQFEGMFFSSRFHFDFLRGTDSVFHFNPRFDEKAVVRNSCLNGRWGAEERQGGFPFLPGKQFEIKVLCEEAMFKVAVNGLHLLEFRHRFKALNEVTLLQVQGDIKLSMVAPSMV
ncbi:UNVERIFIED_CONTAM: hypothetical protein FKN15_008946, partial [Acipenser sinensis]